MTETDLTDLCIAVARELGAKTFRWTFSGTGETAFLVLHPDNEEVWVGLEKCGVPAEHPLDGEPVRFVGIPDYPRDPAAALALLQGFAWRIEHAEGGVSVEIWNADWVKVKAGANDPDASKATCIAICRAYLAAKGATTHPSDGSQIRMVETPKGFIDAAQEVIESASKPTAQHGCPTSDSGAESE